MSSHYKAILEAALLSSGRPLDLDHLSLLFAEESQPPSRRELRALLSQLQDDCAERGIELMEVASGFRFQVKSHLHPWLKQLLTRRAPRYSRALLETLALVAYRQPITRAEIEKIRGVSVSTQIMRTLQDYQWIRVLGHRESPGRPALYGTTRAFLDHFNLKHLSDLPTLAELKDLELQPDLLEDDSELEEEELVANPDMLPEALSPSLRALPPLKINSADDDDISEHPPS
jgi:segregation and condensation protein B